MWSDEYISIGALHFSSCHTQPLINFLIYEHMWTARVSGREHTTTSLPPKEAVTLVCVANQGWNHVLLVTAIVDNQSDGWQVT